MLSGLRLLMEDEVLQSVTRSAWSEELGGPWQDWAQGYKTGGGMELEHDQGVLTS